MKYVYQPQVPGASLSGDFMETILHPNILEDIAKGFYTCSSASKRSVGSTLGASYPKT